MKKLIIILIVTALGSFLGMAYAHIDFMKITDEVLNEYELMEALYILSELDHGSYLIFGTILGGIYGLILITISIGLYVFVSRFFKILKKSELMNVRAEVIESEEDKEKGDDVQK